MLKTRKVFEKPIAQKDQKLVLYYCDRYLAFVDDAIITDTPDKLPKDKATDGIIASKYVFDLNENTYKEVQNQITYWKEIGVLSDDEDTFEADVFLSDLKAQKFDDAVKYFNK